MQRPQFFLSESTWDSEQVNTRRLELLLANPATAPHPGGVLVIDDSGDRKSGSATAHIGKQYLGSVGKVDRGVVTVTACWADERVYYPLHAVPYTLAHHFQGQERPGFPYQAADHGGPRRPGQGGRASLPGDGRLRRPGQLPARSARCRASVRDGPQAPARRLGVGY